MHAHVSEYRRVAEQMAGKPGAINNGAAAVLILQLCDKLEQSWIPVSERLPGEGEQVIVWMPDCPHHPCGGIDMGSCMTGSWGVSWMVSEGRSAFPSHWMPLPEPPEHTS